MAREAYAEFIGQIELREIWLKSARVGNDCGPIPPDELTVVVDGDSRWEPLPRGFRAFQRYRIRLSGHSNAECAEIEVAFAADYDSDLSMTDETFETFKHHNLPLNTWPYLREFAATTVGRMGWRPITLPAFKVGTPPDASRTESGSTSSGEPRARRTRQRRPTPNDASTRLVDHVPADQQ